MKAFAIVGNQIRFAGLLVVPRLIGGTGFHGGKDADDSGMLAAFGKRRFDALLFSEVPFADELDLHARVRC